MKVILFCLKREASMKASFVLLDLLLYIKSTKKERVKPGPCSLCHGIN